MSEPEIDDGKEAAPVVISGSLMLPCGLLATGGLRPPVTPGLRVLRDLRGEMF
jgi:hypothetical protein